MERPPSRLVGGDRRVARWGGPDLPRRCLGVRRRRRRGAPARTWTYAKRSFILYLFDMVSGIIQTAPTEHHLPPSPKGLLSFASVALAGTIITLILGFKH